MIRFIPPSRAHETMNESSVVEIALGDCLSVYTVYTYK